jgi:hypothetical protein
MGACGHAALLRWKKGHDERNLVVSSQALGRCVEHGHYELAEWVVDVFALSLTRAVLQHAISLNNPIAVGFLIRKYPSSLPWVFDSSGIHDTCLSGSMGREFVGVFDVLWNFYKNQLAQVSETRDSYAIGARYNAVECVRLLFLP